MDRRQVLGLTGAALLATRASAATMGPDGFLPGDSTEFVKLWPGTPPGGEGIALTLKVTDAVQPDGYDVRAVSQIQTPGFFVYRPAKAEWPGPAGHSRRRLCQRRRRPRRARDRAAFRVAGHHLFRAALSPAGRRLGTTASDVPLQDAQRAMRLIRRDATKYGVDPARLAAIGFSAGGHLSASLALRHAMTVYAPIDAADALDAKPIVTGNLYPVITMGPGAHQGSRDMLLGMTPAAEAVAKYSLEKQVATDAVPSFICLAADDDHRAAVRERHHLLRRAAGAESAVRAACLRSRRSRLQPALDHRQALRRLAAIVHQPGPRRTASRPDPRQYAVAPWEKPPSGHGAAC